MPIKTGRVRRAFDTALSKNKISANMLLMSLAFINYQIEYNPKVSLKQLVKYEEDRIIVAKCAIKNFITKQQIQEAIDTISEERYPSDGQIQSLIKLIKENVYFFSDSIIDLADEDMKKKSSTETKPEKVKRSKGEVQEANEFYSICDYIESKILNSKLSYKMQDKIKSVIDSKKYDYSLVMECCQLYCNEMVQSIFDAGIVDDYGRVCYLMGIICKKMYDIIARSESDKRHIIEYFDNNAEAIIDGECTLEEMIYLQCDKYEYASYYGKHDYVKNQLLLALERAKQKQEEEAEDDDDLPFQW